MTEIYGKTNADRMSEENNIARKIVKEISDFGVTDRQRRLIMYYLCLELEDVEKMKQTIGFLKETYHDLTITGIYGSESE